MGFGDEPPAVSEPLLPMGTVLTMERFVIEAFEKLVSRASRRPDADGTFSQLSIPKPESPNE
jgi:hypothetical protein